MDESDDTDAEMGLTTDPMREVTFIALGLTVAAAHSDSNVSLSVRSVRQLLIHIESLQNSLEANDIPVCRLCGCTEVTPCEPPCGWAEGDLCTSCAPFAIALSEPAATPPLVLLPPAKPDL